LLLVEVIKSVYSGEQIMYITDLYRIQVKELAMDNHLNLLTNF